MSFKVGREDVVGELMFHAKITPLTPLQQRLLEARIQELEGVRTVFHHEGASPPRFDVFEIIIEDGVAPYAHEVRAQVAEVVSDFQEGVITLPSPH